MTGSSGKIVGYYGGWSVYYPGRGKCEPDDLPANMCTHMIYSFIGLNPDGTIKILDPYAAISLGGFNKFNELKRQNRNLKTLVAIGGWNEGSETYSQVMNDSGKRAAFVENAARFVREHGFDGLDLDWEYPADRGGIPSDKRAFSLLIKELRSKFNKYNLLLSAAVGASPSRGDASYEIPELNKYLDFINLMTYDIHSHFDGRTGHNAPLYPDVNHCVDYWISRGASSSKLILGIPAYGHTFHLLRDGQYGVGCPTNGPGNPGPYTRSPGTLGYNEVSKMLKESTNWKVYWDDAAKVPYAVKDAEWISYDNINSVQLKANCAHQKRLGGCMIWSLENDDFRGDYSNSKYPLLSAIRNGFRY